MSLITDVDYLRHRLRLSYLRHSDDPYAPRIVSFPANYDSNPYIHTAGLADADRWPELNYPMSPVPTPHEEVPFNTRGGHSAANPGEPSGKWPGATGLNYTQTIMGNRSGIAGMRVNGRRASKATPHVTVPVNDSGEIQARVEEVAQSAATVNIAPGMSFPIKADGAMAGVVEVDLSRRRSSGGSTVVGRADLNAPSIGTPSAEAAGQAQASEAAELPPLPPGFRPPRFARGAEMEARRRRRIQMRLPIKAAGGTENTRQTSEAPRPVLLVDDSSSEEESAPPTVEGSMTESDGEDAGEMPSDFEDVSFLRPDYRQRNTSNGSDGASLLSAQLGISVSQASVNSSLQAALSERTRARLSPVAEVSKAAHKDQTTGALQGLQIQQQTAYPRRPSRTHTKGGSAELVPGAVASSASNVAVAATNPAADPNVRHGLDMQPRKTSSSRSKTAALSSKPSVTAFRKKPLPTRAQSSALTARLAAKSSGTENAFHYLYAGISGREDSHYTLRVYFPHSITYKHSPREIRVRKDVSVEEVIGHALWVYCEDKAEPPLDDPIPPEMDKKVRLSSAGWCLRIVEEDTEGEVDEDYPVIGRGGPISSWLKHDLAVCEASDTQIKQNLDLDSSIIRRASRLMKSSQDPDAPQEGLEPPPRRRQEGTGYSDDEVLPPPVIHQTGTGEKALLRVRWADYADSAHYWTTLAVTTDTYMADILEMACRKRRITNSKDWALLLDDRSILVPLDRTVASLQDRKSLIIMKRSLLDTLQPGQGRKPGRSSDPNASIFDKSKHYSDAAQDGLEFTTYKKFVVRRKVPMVFGSHERILAMDGDYIHIIPSATKALLDSLKTSSYHIKTVLECSMPKKDSSTVRLVIQRDLTKKRYDFEAESRASAMEIVAIVKTMQKAYEGGQRSTMYRSKSTRRPRSTALGMID